MMWYVLICLCLSLAGAAGLQFFYLAYLEKIDRERKRRISELERHIKYLTRRLAESETQISETEKPLENLFGQVEPDEDEVWADYIEDK